jgi:methylmalonyl-CoA mutase
MNDLSNPPKTAAAVEQLNNKVRFVTAASLFDGHDASINIMRRILQSNGVEVVHLGHNRSVDEVVTAALTEDVQGIAISSYQGGHVEYFKYMIDLLKARGGAHIKVFGGGGGVIVADEIAELHAYGVTKIFSPEDGQRMGLVGMIESMIAMCDIDLSVYAPKTLAALRGIDTDGEADTDDAADTSNISARHRPLAQLITALENNKAAPGLRAQLLEAAADLTVPTLGITGTGGAGKSSLTDELIRRIRLDQGDGVNIAIISIDPSRRKSGGALLGDRIRMNAINPWGADDAQQARVFMRSLATREAGSEISSALPDVIAACKVAGFDLVIVETSGIGQGDAAIVQHVDVSMYVMTPEFGAASQLEKIDMLDFADVIAINKFDRKGSQDALRDVAKQYQRNRELWSESPNDMPVYGTQASRFNDDGVTALYQGLLPKLAQFGFPVKPGKLPPVGVKHSSGKNVIVPPARNRYLAEIADTLRAYHKNTGKQVALARERQQLQEAKRMLAAVDKGISNFDQLDELITQRDAALGANEKKLLALWPDMQAAYAGDEYVVKIRDKEIRTKLTQLTLSGTKIRKVALPRFEDHGEILRFLMLENVPGSFPYTAGVFAFKRENEDPTRMFAGEGDAFRTNRRFKLVSTGMDAKRLSTAFDSVTLYGADPALRPDIYGKVGNAGVSIATLDDMKVLYDGFDLTSPTTSVSMTINGPAPTILAMFMNTAIDQQIDKFVSDNKRQPSPDEAAKIKQWVLQNVRGTVQADILKEDQGQNTCIFSTEFSLKVMGDIQEYFVRHQVRNFYSVSISGYHIAEAGANPISQLAFTLSNGFTFVEAYLARGMHIDDFAPNLSFFFSNGMDPEYTVLGRVARRLWAVAMRDKYGANERSQKLKYHIQTSGRSLHAQEIDFNDIRTTLQALIAIYDNCNSLHTNAYDEAITTPTDESVRRALAIQLIINREWGLAKNENPNQGAFIIDELTDLLEEAVLQEFERIAERGGVLGAMETGYQRGKIQEESMLYEHQKHDGTLPIIGVNTFRNPKVSDAPVKIELARSTDAEKQSQLTRLTNFQQLHAAESPAALAALRQAAIDNDNVFDKLMDAVRVCSLGQITNALFEVGGQYRRNM